MISRIRTISLILLSTLLCQCQSTPKSTQQRDLSSLSQEELEADFLANLSLYMAGADASLSDPFASTMLNIIKRSYFYMEKFDQELDRIYQECITVRGNNQSQSNSADCENPMDLPDYKKMMAARIVFERQKQRIEYHYSRLLDLANYFDSGLKTVYPETTKQMEELSEQQQRSLSQDSRQILNRWNTELNDRIQISTQTDGPMSYELALELFKTKEEAQMIWSEAAGKPFKASSLLDSSPSLDSYYQQNQQAFDAEVSGAADIRIESLDNLIEEIDRAPDSSWANHTGRSFPRGHWALTYDDGPKAATTNQLIDILKNKGWHATFFWLAQNAKSRSNQKVVQKTKSYGMGLAHHSYSHSDLSKSKANLDREIGDAKRTLESVYNTSVRFFRLPYGAGTKSARVRNKIISERLQHVAWNVDSLDWKDPSPQSIVNRIRKQMAVQGRGIILMHDIHQKTINATKILADNYNFKVVPLSSAISGAGLMPSPSEGTPTATFKAHQRIIVWGTLNVRTHAGVTSNEPCGFYQKNTRVSVIARDTRTGWLQVDTQVNPPLLHSNSSKQCPRDQRKAWISGHSKYSRPL